MAPNLKHHPLQPLTGLTTKIVVAKDYDRPTPVVIVDSASYWEWNEPSDVLSTSHIVSNLVKAGEAVMVKGNTIKNTDISSALSSSDDYWAESVQDDLLDEVATADCSVVPCPLQQVEPATYWDEASHSCFASDNYWDTSSSIAKKNSGGGSSSSSRLPSPVAVIRNPTLNHDESTTYWQERSHETSENDAYWRESFPEESSSTDGNYEYWTWKTSERTESDKYWAWSTQEPLPTLSVV